MTTKEEVFQNCSIDGNIVKLPATQLDRALYMQVKSALEKIGGKWKGNKVQGFVFESDPTDLIQNSLANGVARSLKKEFQFFETPDALADELVEWADLGLKDSVLEPSAGRGAIVKAIHRKFPTKLVDCVELMDANLKVLMNSLQNVAIHDRDFLNPIDKYFIALRVDRVIANPPFSNNQDIDHIRQMYHFLKPGGTLVSVASIHWCTSKNSKEKEFRLWIQGLGANVKAIPAGTFKESGTNVAACIIKITKPVHWDFT
jgi:predicted RNA methylase